MAAVDDSSDTGAAPTPPPAAKPEADDKAPAMPDQQPRWADPIFRAGLAVGSGLFVIGILCQTFNLIAPTLSILIICSGLGIIFGAFGSTAVINYKGVVIAGVAAVAVALLLVVDWVMRESLVRLEVDGDVKGARLELFGDEAYPGADHGGRRFEFFIIGRESLTGELLHERGGVHDAPMLSDLSVLDAHVVGDGDGDGPAGRWDAHELAIVGPCRRGQRRHQVAIAQYHAGFDGEAAKGGAGGFEEREDRRLAPVHARERLMFLEVVRHQPIHHGEVAGVPSLIEATNDCFVFLGHR